MAGYWSHFTGGEVVIFNSCYLERFRAIKPARVTLRPLMLVTTLTPDYIHVITKIFLVREFLGKTLYTGRGYPQMQGE